MIRIISLALPRSNRGSRKTVRKGGRPCSRFLSLLIVALLALPSFAHETEHHRVTEEILERIQDLQDDVDRLLGGNTGGGGGNTGGGGGNTGGGGGNTGGCVAGKCYGAASYSIEPNCVRGVGGSMLWNYASLESVENQALASCRAKGGTRCNTLKFGSAYAERYRCGAIAVGGFGDNSSRSCAQRWGWGASENAARSSALSQCRNAGVYPCQVVVSACTD